MQRLTLAFVTIPPAVLATTIVVANPAALTWPMVVFLGVLFGVAGAVVQHMLEPH